MPLPNIRHRSRRWKSCGNITTTSSAHKNLFRVNQLHKKAAATEPLYINNNNNKTNKNGLSQDRKLSPPKKTVYIFNNGDSEGCDSSSRVARLRNPSADDVEVTRRRALLLMRRQGRQLSDPSSYKLLQQQLVAARAVADSRHNQRYLVVDRRLDSLSLEPSSSQKNAVRQSEANGHINISNNVRENNIQVSNGGGEGVPRYLLQKQQQQLQRVKSAHRGPWGPTWIFSFLWYFLFN